MKNLTEILTYTGHAHPKNPIFLYFGAGEHDFPVLWRRRARIFLYFGAGEHANDAFFY